MKKRKSLLRCASIFWDAANDGESFLFIENDYGGDNEFFMKYLSDLKYKVTETSKYCKKISWENVK